MNRGLHDIANRFKRKTAASLSPVEPKPRSGIVSRTLLVTAIGLFAGAAALGMVQHPDRSDIPSARIIQSVLPLTAEQVEVSTPSAAPLHQRNPHPRGRHAGRGAAAPGTGRAGTANLPHPRRQRPQHLQALSGPLGPGGDRRRRQSDLAALHPHARQRDRRPGRHPHAARGPGRQQLQGRGNHREHRSPDPRRGRHHPLAVRRHRRGRHPRFRHAADGRHPQRQDRLPARPAPGRPVPRGLRSALARRPLCRRRTRAGAGVHQRREDLQRRLVQPRRQERLVLRFRRHQPARRLPSHRPEVQPHQLDLRHAHAPHPQDLDGAQGRGLRRAFGHADPFHG